MIKIICALILSISFCLASQVAGGGASAGPNGASTNIPFNENLLPAGSRESGVEATTSAAASSQFQCVRLDFPNYFSEFHKTEAKQLIEHSLKSILQRLTITHIDPTTARFTNDRFFEKLNRIVESKAPGAKVYIAGGMVRSLLGYIYKKLYNADKRGGFDIQGVRLTKRALVLETFHNIIYGKRRTDSLLSEFAVNEEDTVPYKKRDKEGKIIEVVGGSSIYEQGEKFKPKEVLSLEALGIGSDFDILIDFPQGFSGNKKQILEDITKFINSAQLHFGFDQGDLTLKKAILPVGDVQDYQEQLGSNHNRSAVKQGGSALDFLAFSIDDGMRMPEDHHYILDDFLDGYVRYLEPQVSARDADKQTVRGLRSLLELPFLRLHPESMTLMLKEMNALVMKGGSISYAAKDQLEKMVRNARFEGAHNRFVNSLDPCMPDGDLTRLVQQLSQNNKNGALPAIPEFVKNEKIVSRHLSAKAHEADKYLISAAYFIETYTNNGILYHGTPDIRNILSMIRNGLVISSNKQGLAAHGRGVYTAKDKGTSEGYAGGAGIVLAFRVNNHSNLRILDLNTEKGREFLEKVGNVPDKHQVLADIYHIDIIIPQMYNPYPLLQNADVVIVDKDVLILIKAAVEKVKDEIKMDNIFTSDKVRKYVEHLHPKQGYTALALFINPNFDTREGFELLSRYVERALDENQWDVSLEVLLHQDLWTDNIREKALVILEAKLRPLVPELRNFLDVVPFLNGSMTDTQLQKLIRFVTLHKLNPIFFDGLSNDDVEEFISQTREDLDIMIVCIKMMTENEIINKNDKKSFFEILKKLQYNETTITKIRNLVKLRGLLDINAYVLPQLLPIADQITDSIIEKLMKLRGLLDINSSGFPELLPLVDQITDSRIEKLMKLKGLLDINAYVLPQLLPLADQITDSIIEKLMKLKGLLDINSSVLPELLPLADQITDSIIEKLMKLKGLLDINFSVLPKLLPLVDQITDSRVTNFVKLKAVGIIQNVSAHDFEKLLPILDQVSEEKIDQILTLRNKGYILYISIDALAKHLNIAQFLIDHHIPIDDLEVLESMTQPSHKAFFLDNAFKTKSMTSEKIQTFRRIFKDEIKSIENEYQRNDLWILFSDHNITIQQFNKAKEYAEKLHIKNYLWVLKRLVENPEIDDDSIHGAERIFSFFSDEDFKREDDPKIYLLDKLCAYKDLMPKITQETITDTEDVLLYFVKDESHKPSAKRSSWGTVIHALLIVEDPKEFIKALKHISLPNDISGKMSLISYLLKIRDRDTIMNKLKSLEEMSFTHLDILLSTRDMEDRKRFMLSHIVRLINENYPYDTINSCIVFLNRAFNYEDQLLSDLIESIEGHESALESFYFSDSFFKMIKDIPDRVNFLKMYWEIFQANEKQDLLNKFYVSQLDNYLSKSEPEERMVRLQNLRTKPFQEIKRILQPF